MCRAFRRVGSVRYRILLRTGRSTRGHCIGREPNRPSPRARERQSLRSLAGLFYRLSSCAGCRCRDGDPRAAPPRACRLPRRRRPPLLAGRRLPRRPRRAAPRARLVRAVAAVLVRLARQPRRHRRPLGGHAAARGRQPGLVVGRRAAGPPARDQGHLRSRARGGPQRIGRRKRLARPPELLRGLQERVGRQARHLHRAHRGRLRRGRARRGRCLRRGRAGALQEARAQAGHVRPGLVLGKLPLPQRPRRRPPLAHHLPRRPYLHPPAAAPASERRRRHPRLRSRRPRLGLGAGRILRRSHRRARRQGHGAPLGPHRARRRRGGLLRPPHGKGRDVVRHRRRLGKGRLLLPHGRAARGGQRGGRGHGEGQVGGVQTLGQGGAGSEEEAARAGLGLGAAGGGGKGGRRRPSRRRARRHRPARKQGRGAGGRQTRWRGLPGPRRRVRVRRPRGVRAGGRVQGHPHRRHGRVGGVPRGGQGGRAREGDPAVPALRLGVRGGGGGQPRVGGQGRGRGGRRVARRQRRQGGRVPRARARQGARGVGCSRDGGEDGEVQAGGGHVGGGGGVPVQGRRGDRGAPLCQEGGVAWGRGTTAVGRPCMYAPLSHCLVCFRGCLRSLPFGR